MSHSPSPKPKTSQRVSGFARNLLTHRRLPWVSAVLAMLLCAPAIDIGFFLDDYIHQAALIQPEELPEIHASPDRLFEFVSADKKVLSDSMPWWVSEDLKLAFWRPISGASHWLDHHLWPESPRWMHIHSLLWLGLVVLLASLAFRRLLGDTTWVAGLAALLFAVDDVHAWPAMWIANRNALLSVAWALLSLLSYDAWRRQGRRWGAVATPLFLLLAVLSGESAVAGGAYLLAYALTLDTGSWSRRLMSLVPSAVIGIIWLAIYKWQGFGARGSSAYLDPLTSPIQFLGGLFERLPMLMLGLWTPIPADFYLLTSAEGQRWMWALAMGLTLLVAALFTPMLIHDRRARFLALGLVGSLVPASIIFPMNRQLLFAGFATSGLLALFVEHARSPQTQRPTTASPTETHQKTSGWGRRALRLTAMAALGVHLFLAPWILLGTPSQLHLLARLMDRAVVSLPSDPEVRSQRVIVVHSPGHVFTSGSKAMHVLRGQATPRDLLVLSGTIWSLEIERLDERSLAIRPDGGFMAPAGHDPTGTGGHLNLMRAFAGFDLIFQDSRRRPKVGDRFDRTGVEIEITALTEDGRPGEAVFRFDRSLEDPALRWVRWQDGVFMPFSLPEVGEPVTLPPPTLFPQKPSTDS